MAKARTGRNGTTVALVRKLLERMSVEEIAVALAVRSRSVERWQKGTVPRSLTHVRALERLEAGREDKG